MTRVGLLLLVGGCGRIDFELALDAAFEAALDADVDTSLVAHFPLDVDCSDSSPNALPMTCQPPACPTVVAGVVGTALSFDGSDDHCSLADDPRLHLTTGFTISLWLRKRTPGALETPIAKPLRTGPGASFELSLGSTQTIYCTTAPPMDEECMVGPLIPANEWTHVALVWDGAIKRMHLGGAVTSEAHVTIWDDSPLLLGRDIENTTMVRGQFPGDIDEVRIYNRVLDDAELAALAVP